MKKSFVLVEVSRSFNWSEHMEIKVTQFFHGTSIHKNFIWIFNAEIDFIFDKIFVYQKWLRLD